MLKSKNFMHGVAARSAELEENDIRLMQDAGIGWLRYGDFLFDPVAFLEGHPQSKAFHEAGKRLRFLQSAGFQFIGITPGPREMAKTKLEPGSPEYFQAYGRICRFFAEEFKDVIGWWQVANELDIWIFRDKLDLQQSVEFLKVGIRAMKETVPSLNVGFNVTLFPSLPGEVDGNTDAHEGLTIAKGLCHEADLDFDFAGLDSYPGSWRKGGPSSWEDYLEQYYKLTNKPIVVMEYGYASAGEIMSSEEAQSGQYPCDLKKWKFSWQEEHSEQAQAKYIQEAMSVFLSKPYVQGAFYYNWRDARKCWQCKEPDCPIETSWGLLDQEGNPKPSYALFREMVPALT